MKRSPIVAAPPLVVLLAGGFGTRVAHLLPGVPKPMAEIEGSPFLEWIVRFYRRCGAERFVLSTGHLSEVIESHFAGSGIVCRREDVPLGTAGGFLNAIEDELIDVAGCLVANGDSLVVADPLDLSRRALAESWDGAVLAVAMPDASRYGTLETGGDGCLVGFREKRPGSALINAGVYWFSPQALRGFPVDRPLSFETAVFPKLIEQGARIGVVAVEAPFIDIGTPQSLAQGAEFIRKNADRF